MGIFQEWLQTRLHEDTNLDHLRAYVQRNSNYPDAILRAVRGAVNDPARLQKLFNQFDLNFYQPMQQKLGLVSSIAPQADPMARQALQNLANAHRHQDDFVQGNHTAWGSYEQALKSAQSALSQIDQTLQADPSQSTARSQPGATTGLV